ncbi:MAG: hypothetical protein WEB37_08060 [Bacteroidota bacterium]
MIDVIWYGHNGEYRVWWDMAMLSEIFSRELWDPVRGHQFAHYDGFESLPQDAPGAVLVIPARHNADKIGLINQKISRLGWVLLLLVGDEEALFPVDQLSHPNMVVWAMTPHPGKWKRIDRYLINGYTPYTRKTLQSRKDNADKRELGFFFAGQNNHDRRAGCLNALKKMKNGEVIETPGFTKGLPHEEYYAKMASAKVIPCPSGAAVPDSFRLWEALEAGCVPIADVLAPVIKEPRYWNILLGEDELPFPTIKYWKDLAGTVQYFVDTYPRFQNKAFAWWQKFKRQMAYNLEEDIIRVSGVVPEESGLRDKITVLIPTSPIKSHPDTEVLEKVIGTVRERLPDSEIILMFDGVREEQKDYTERYQEYIRRVLWKANFEWKNVLPLVFETHHHQVAMTREAMKYVRTPTILFVEHDAPLCEEIPFPNLVEAVISGDANMIRLNHEAKILDDHKYLTLDESATNLYGAPLIRTAQWSQRPHLASAEFYRRILADYFSQDAITMIEDRIHGPIVQAWLERGRPGWNDWKIWVYAPDGDQKRSYHLDGRGGDKKYEMTF